MVRRALAPGGAALVGAAGVAFALGGRGAAASAAIGIVVVLANFAAHGWSLAKASDVSVTAVQAVALAGFVVRLGVIVALLFALDRLAWFSPLAFGLTVVPATLSLLAYEAVLVLRRGIGVRLEVPPEPVAARAARALAAKEGLR